MKSFPNPNLKKKMLKVNHKVPAHWRWYFLCWCNVSFLHSLGGIFFLHRKVRGHSRLWNSASGAGTSWASLLFCETFIRLDACCCCWHEGMMPGFLGQGQSATCHASLQACFYSTRWVVQCAISDSTMRESKKVQTIKGNQLRLHSELSSCRKKNKPLALHLE